MNPLYAHVSDLSARDLYCYVVGGLENDMISIRYPFDRYYTREMTISAYAFKTYYVPLPSNVNGILFAKSKPFTLLDIHGTEL